MSGRTQSYCLSPALELLRRCGVKGGGLSATLAGVSRLAPRDFAVKSRFHHCEGRKAFWGLRALHDPIFALHGAA